MIDPRLRLTLQPVADEWRKLRAWRATSWCWAAGAAACLILLVIALTANISLLTATAFVGAATIIVALVVRWRVGSENVDYHWLAERIEREHPELQALLLAAVEQVPREPEKGLSYLQQRVIREAVEHSRKHLWGHGFAERLHLVQCTHWAVLVVFAATWIGALVATPKLASLAHRRSVTQVSVTPGDTMLEKGSSLVVLGKFDGPVPAEASLVISTGTDEVRRVPLVKNLADPVFGGSVAEVKSDLSYHIEYSGERTRDFKVRVFEHPRLVRSDAHLKFPEYTGLPDKAIPDTLRVSAVEGSDLLLKLELNKPVKTAKLVGKNSAPLALTPEPDRPQMFRVNVAMAKSDKLSLQLVDADGRTNKVPHQFDIEVLKNRAPELKVAFPKGDVEVSPLQELGFEGEAWDDFGLRAFGLAFNLAGGETQFIELGTNSPPRDKTKFQHLFALEGVGAQPEDVVSWYVWAEDVGPDGKPRRTYGDMFFAELKPFDEIFREAQAMGGESAGESGAGQEGAELLELQKQIITATWKLQRQASQDPAAARQAKFISDVTVVRDSQKEAVSKAEELEAKFTSVKQKTVMRQVVEQMEKAITHLTEAPKNNEQFTPAIDAERTAYQQLFKLAPREFQVARSRSQGGGGKGGQRNQRQLNELDFKQAEDRYETARQASPQQSGERREQLQILNRLKELAQRQQDINERLKELQTALQEAENEAAREELRRQLKRLREEQREMVADVDELQQRMERAQNQSNMADARKQLEQSRSEVQRASEALEGEAVSQALSAGTRAERQLGELRDDLRKKNSSEFAEEMRQMRSDARQLAKDQEEIGKKLGETAEPKRKSLSESSDTKELTEKMLSQTAALTNLMNNIRSVSEQAEIPEPLLSRQLYDTLRKASQDDARSIAETRNELVESGQLTSTVYNILQRAKSESKQSLEVASELVRERHQSEAKVLEQRTRQGIEDLKRGVERAAESVIGDDTEALRTAKRELDDLSKQLEQEIAAASPDAARDQQNGQGQQSEQSQQGNQEGSNPGERQLAQGQGNQQGQQGEQQNGQAGNGQQPGESQRNQTAGNSQQQGSQQGQQGQQGQEGRQQGEQGQSGQQGGQQAQNAQSGSGESGSSQRGERQQGSQPGQRANQRGGGGRDGGFMDQLGGGPGGNSAPLSGPDYAQWSDRLRDVEEMIEPPDLRNDVARVRDRARAVRAEFKRHSKAPNWDMVQTQIAAPLAEIRRKVADELARRESNDALVPIDRDPVPQKFAELVRRYYEQLGTGSGSTNGAARSQ